MDIAFEYKHKSIGYEDRERFLIVNAEVLKDIKLMDKEEAINEYIRNINNKEGIPQLVILEAVPLQTEIRVGWDIKKPIAKNNDKNKGGK